MSYATIAAFVETNLPQQPVALRSLFFRKLLCVLSRVESLQRIFMEMSIKVQTEFKRQAEVSLI